MGGQKEIWDEVANEMFGTNSPKSETQLEEARRVAQLRIINRLRLDRGLCSKVRK